MYRHCTQEIVQLEDVGGDCIYVDNVEICHDNIIMFVSRCINCDCANRIELEYYDE